MKPSAVLVPGGLYESMDADRFWRRTGVIAGLARHGLRVLIVDRPSRPASWAEEAEALSAALGEWRALPIVAGSNGCSVAVRLAVDFPSRLSSLVLCWPATAGDPIADEAAAAVLRPPVSQTTR